MSFFDNVKTSLEVAGKAVSAKAPEICIGLGIISGVAAVVVASKETIKAQEILEEFHDDKRDIEVCKATTSENDYTEEDRKHDVIVAYSKCGKNLVKNYIPAIGLEAMSVVLILVGLGIMRKRNAALMASYNALYSAFELYRKRVIEDKGEEADVYYMTGKKLKTMKVDGPNGEKEEAKVLQGGDVKPAISYTIKFSKYKDNGELNLQWSPDRYYDLQYIKGQGDALDDLLYHRTTWTPDHKVKKPGWVMLNETIEAFGEDATTDGGIVGNLYSEKGEPGRNGCIRLHVTEGVEEDPDNPGKMIPYFLIDPNVDGPIIQLLGNWKSSRV